jgi:hypothetical protein
MKKFMKQLKTNPDVLESNKLHNGVAIPTGKVQPVKLDSNAQKNALKAIQKREGRR